MVNIEYLKKNNLLENYKRFMELTEGFGWAQPIEEDNDEENQEQMPNQQMQDQQMQGQQMSDMTGNEQGGIPMQNDMQQGNEPYGPDSIGQGNGMEMGDQGFGESGADINPEPGNMEFGADDEVIDVEDMVQAQEKVNNKVVSVGQDLGKIDARIEKLMNSIESMESMISNNNAEIENLKNEFEKRNPTQEEKLGLRSLDSYPYGVTPEEYWKKKSEDSNYNPYSDGNEPEKEYTITKNDISDVTDKEMSDSFDIDDDLNQDIKKIFGI